MASAPDTDATPPPNLRSSGESEAKECGNCSFYDHTHCTKFPPLCVDGDWLCDAWKAGSHGDVVPDTESGDQPSPAKTVRGVEKATLARLRASARNA
jgi:hypothetical protein